MYSCIPYIPMYSPAFPCVPRIPMYSLYPHVSPCIACILFDPLHSHVFPVSPAFPRIPCIPMYPLYPYLFSVYPLCSLYPHVFPVSRKRKRGGGGKEGGYIPWGRGGRSPIYHFSHKGMFHSIGYLFQGITLAHCNHSSRPLWNRKRFLRPNFMILRLNIRNYSQICDYIFPPFSSLSNMETTFKMWATYAAEGTVTSGDGYPTNEESEVRKSLANGCKTHRSRCSCARDPCSASTWQRGSMLKPLVDSRHYRGLWNRVRLTESSVERQQVKFGSDQICCPP